jgi:hypothetical protein
VELEPTAEAPAHRDRRRGPRRHTDSAA